MTITLNHDKEQVKQIREAIKANDGYCPCQIEKTEYSRCICKSFLDSPSSGWCHCGLYYKED